MKRYRISLLLVLFCLLGAVAVYGQKKEKAKAEPYKPVLLVIDIQNAYLPFMDEKDVKPGMENINALIDLFRKNNYPVVRVYHQELGGDPKPGTEAFEFPKYINVREDDAKVIKHHPSAFAKTDLEKILKEKGGNTLYLCGLSAVGCVLSTYFGATEREYETFMVSDAIISHNADLTKSVTRITRSLPLKALALHLKVLSGDVRKMADMPADVLAKEYGIESAAQLNVVGYYLITKNRPADAIAVFQANARLYPNEANSYDSLGEAYERNGQKDLALANYEKACQKARETNDKQLPAFEKNYDRLKGAAK